LARGGSEILDLLSFDGFDKLTASKLRTSFADWDFRSLRQAQGRLFDGSTKLTAGKVRAGRFDRPVQLTAGKLITALGWKTHNGMRPAAGFFFRLGGFAANHSYFIAIILSIRPDSSVK
jgi:hypothetical protein